MHIIPIFLKFVPSTPSRPCFFCPVFPPPGHSDPHPHPHLNPQSLSYSKTHSIFPETRYRPWACFRARSLLRSPTTSLPVVGIVTLAHGSAPTSDAGFFGTNGLVWTTTWLCRRFRDLLGPMDAHGVCMAHNYFTDTRTTTSKPTHELDYINKL